MKNPPPYKRTTSGLPPPSLFLSGDFFGVWTRISLSKPSCMGILRASSLRPEAMASAVRFCSAARVCWRMAWTTGRESWSLGWGVEAISWELVGQLLASSFWECAGAFGVYLSELGIGIGEFVDGFWRVVVMVHGAVIGIGKLNQVG
jgi:hypothetical protein